MRRKKSNSLERFYQFTFWYRVSSNWVQIFVHKNSDENESILVF